MTDRLVELIPGATREPIDGAGHMPHLTTPERYMETLTEVLSGGRGNGTERFASRERYGA